MVPLLVVVVVSTGVVVVVEEVEVELEEVVTGIAASATPKGVPVS